MQLVHSIANEAQEETITTAINTSSRRNSLAISALLNDVSIDPIQQQHPLTPNDTACKQHQQQITDDSPISSESSSPTSEHINTTYINELWNHSRTGTHQANDGSTIIISALSKAKRKRILPYQYKRLMETFESTDTPSSEIRGNLAIELDMTKREVQVWFQNRRAKINRNKTPVRHRSFQYDELSREDTDISTTKRRRASEFSITAPNNHNNYTLSLNSNNSTKMKLEAPYQPPLLENNEKSSAN